MRVQKRFRHARRRRGTGPVVALSLCVAGAVAVVAGLPFARPGGRDLAGDPAVAQAAQPEQPGQPAPPEPPRTAQSAGAGAANRSRRTPASSAELPDGGPVPVTGAGTWHVVPGTSDAVGSGTVRTYTVEVEDGVTLPDGDVAFGATVQAVLGDPRSWIAGGGTALRRIDSGQPDLHIRMASQKTTRARCGFATKVDSSCRNGADVYLNGARWIRGAVAFGDDLTSYRQYVVNHEVGHFLGRVHERCKVDGGPAPVMMQQTFSTSNNELADITARAPQGPPVPRDGKVCTPNPWPFP